MTPLFEKYRPRTFDEVVGQDKVVARIKALAKRGLTGRAFWIAGQSGTGKTSLARLLAAEVADDFLTREIDAGTLTVSALAEKPSVSHSILQTGKGSKKFYDNGFPAIPQR